MYHFVYIYEYINFQTTHHNLTYMDKEENMLRMPALKKYYDELKPKRKSKKSAKRTIQKIIKKNKGKMRKVYFNQVTKRPTVQPKVDYEKIYGPDEVKKWKVETTTHARHVHRNRNNKVVRYHMPFQKLQKQKNDRRHKRGLSRELFILKDLDQIEFLSKEKDNDVVEAHITDQWKI